MYVFEFEEKTSTIRIRRLQVSILTCYSYRKKSNLLEKKLLFWKLKK